MAHQFRIVSGKSGEFIVRFVYNSEIMVWSEGYKAKASARNCIESVKKNAPGAAIFDLSGDESPKGYRFEIVPSRDGQHFVRLVAANGETMMRSETYTAKASARNCAASIQRNAPEAAVLEEI